MDCRIKSDNSKIRSARHARLYAGHPRLFDRGSKTWMAEKSDIETALRAFCPAMTKAIRDLTLRCERKRASKGVSGKTRAASFEGRYRGRLRMKRLQAALSKESSAVALFSEKTRDAERLESSAQMQSL